MMYVVTILLGLPEVLYQVPGPHLENVYCSKGSLQWTLN